MTVNLDFQLQLDRSSCGVSTFFLHSSLSEIMTFLYVLIKNYNIIGLELIFMLTASVFKPKQYDLKDFTCEIYRNEWLSKTDL